MIESRCRTKQTGYSECALLILVDMQFRISHQAKKVAFFNIIKQSTPQPGAAQTSPFAIER
jgi:hypothetical protein